MSLIVSAKGSGGLPPVSEGNHVGICIGLYDIGVHYNERFEKSSPKVVISWELPEEMASGGPRIVNKTYTASLSEKSALRQDLESWRGRAFTTEELEAFYLANILGKPCMLQIIHNTKGENTYANIKAVTSLHKSIPVPPPVNEPKSFDLDDSDWLWRLDHGELPEWVVKRVKESETYQERMQQGAGSRKTAEEGDGEVELGELVARPEDDQPF